MLLKMSGIHKQFNGVYALKNVGFNIAAGEIHGLVGENGAGKSTLIKVLTGVYGLDSGQVYWNDRPVDIISPSNSRNIGINVIHQDRNLVPFFNGIENVYLGLPPEKKLGGFMIDWQKMERKVRQTAASIGIELDFSKPASSLSPPQKTMVEIVRAMMTDCRLLILDEPTAVFTDKEADLLYEIIFNLKKSGASILYITHRMEEIFHLTDRISVMKNGEMVDTIATKETTKEQIISLMTDNWESEKVQTSKNFGDIVLSVKHLKSADHIVKDVNLSVRKGEILGIFGLGGSGRTETLECIYGLRQIESGSLEIFQSSYLRPTPRDSMKKGVVLICEDRRGMALVTSLNVKQNVVLSTLENYTKFGLSDEKKEIEDTNDKIAELSIKTIGPQQPVRELSGGNQQKVVFAKALLSNPTILLCDEPTQAVDVKTRTEIHWLLQNLANQGAAVVFISSDLIETLNIADNIAVISNGETKQLLKNENVTAEQVLSICYQE